MHRFALILFAVVLVGAVVFALPDPALAGRLADAGDNASDEILAVVGKLFLASLAFAFLLLGWQRQYPAMVVAFLAGCVVAYMVYTPESATSLMKAIAKDIFG